MKTILVVDDEEFLAQALAQDFTRKGFHAMSVTSAREALEVVKKQPVDVLLSDIRMPGMDGMELLKLIKKANPETPKVILMTGFANIELSDAFALGVEAVFSKPFDRKTLLKFIQKICEPVDPLLIARAERFGVDFDTDMILPPANNLVTGKISNISETGFFVALEKQFPPVGSTVTFKIKTQYPGVEMTAQGITQWVRSKANNTMASGCGVQFVNLDEPQKKSLYQLLNTIKTT